VNDLSADNAFASLNCSFDCTLRYQGHFFSCRDESLGCFSRACPK
jgi:hypothetical protein